MEINKVKEIEFGYVPQQIFFFIVVLTYRPA